MLKIAVFKLFEHACAGKLCQSKQLDVQCSVCVSRCSNIKFHRIQRNISLGTGALSYISAAAYQLREANILDIDQPVTIYLDPTDFGYANQWCPDIYGQPAANTPTGRPLSENTTGIVKLALAAGYESNAGQESPLKLAHVASSYRLDA